MERKSNLNLLVKIAVLSALAGVLMLLKIPLPIFPDWLTIDLSDLPAVIGALVLGPLAGVIVEIIKVLINLMLNGTQTGGVGEFANILIGVSFVLPVGLLYKQRKTFKSAITGCLIGIVSMALAGVVLNYFVLLPLYAKVYGIEVIGFVEFAKILPLTGQFLNTVFDFVLIIIAPFNIIKGIMITVITALLYKFVVPALNRMQG